MQTALLMDFGSTYTKITVVHLDNEEILATVQTPTTVKSDIMIGFNAGMKQLKEKLNMERLDFTYKLACSSAAGGLRMIAIGLVPDMTAEAAKRAALGAGAKVLKVFSFKLSFEEIENIVAVKPDILLLAGGTDGGEQETILHNAKMLAESSLVAPIVVAGNKTVRKEICDTFLGAGKEVYPTENVLPELNRLNVDPARQTIREVFMRKIIHAKGLDRVEMFLDSVVMPTPAAVLEAAKLLALGTDNEDGLGDLLVVDPGGATTDVHSLAAGEPTKAEVLLKGLPEPFAKRTVEGDLGLRYSALSLMEAVGNRLLSEVSSMAKQDISKRILDLSNNPEKVPSSDEEYLVDQTLAHIAVKVAVERHVGRVESHYTPFGPSHIQYGKDLTHAKYVIGTGGALVHGLQPLSILKGALFDEKKPTLLKPMEPLFLLDKHYIMAAMGLLAEINPDLAFRILHRQLTHLEEA